MLGSNVMAIINMHESDAALDKLASARVRGMIPFAGRYRLIDFPLSRVVNVGISDVGVLVPCKFGSVIDHLRNAKTWDVARNTGGLYLLVPKESMYDVNSIFKRDLEHLYTHIDYLKGVSKEYVLMTSTSTLTDIDYRDFLETHMSSGADVTLVYKRNPSWVRYSEKTMSLVMEGTHITDVEYVRADMNDYVNSHLAKFIIKRELFIALLEECRERGETDIYKDIIFRNLSRLNVQGYEYKGYAAHINSMHTYLKYSMELLQPEVRSALFSLENPVYTKAMNEAPTLYSNGANIKNSLISNGCHIEGTVENSMLFRGVTVAKGAVVKNSIIMQKGYISEGTELNYVIADKNVTFLQGHTIKGERSYPVVIEKGSVV